MMTMMLMVTIITIIITQQTQTDKDHLQSWDVRSCECSTASPWCCCWWAAHIEAEVGKSEMWSLHLGTNVLQHQMFMPAPREEQQVAPPAQLQCLREHA